MDSPLNNSRFSKADSEAFRSTGASLVFKTIGRNIKPSWTNRIVKDVNDLTYNLDLNLLGKNKFKSVTLQNRKTKNAEQKTMKLSAREKRRSFFAQELMKIVRSARSFDFANPDKDKKQAKDRERKTKFLSLQKYGLSEFQYKNTINGKLKTRPNIHLKFQKQVYRQDCQRVSWYNPQLEINIEKLDQKKYRRVLDKYHPFQSYTDRKVFESEGKLDKVYDIAEGKRRTSPNRIKRTVAIETVPGRKDDQIRQCSYLSYEIEEAEKAATPCSPKYSIVKTSKKFTFSRQVIHDKRGCYR